MSRRWTDNNDNDDDDDDSGDDDDRVIRIQYRFTGLSSEQKLSNHLQYVGVNCC